jgi:hypothetical protein
MKPGIVLLIIFSAALALTACQQPGDATPAPVDVRISMRVEPEPLAVGDATLIITLTDASGAPVDGAALNVHGDMDHEGMVPVIRETSDSANGEYRVPFEWTMGGGWIITVTVSLPAGGQLSDTFEYFVEAASSESIINQHASSSRGAAAPVSIAYEPDHDPAIGGDATVTITLADSQGHAITDAAVTVVGDMAHHGMLPISGTGEHSEAGRYVVPLRWTMAGDWIVTVTVTLADGRQIEETFEQRVVMPSSR